MTSKYTQMVAVEVDDSSKYRLDLSDSNKQRPRIFTVEAVVNTENQLMRLYQVGSYEDPLWFCVRTGLPQLSLFSRRSLVYKNWVKYRLVPLEEFRNGHSKK